MIKVGTSPLAPVSQVKTPACLTDGRMDGRIEPLRFLPSYLVHQRPKLINILKASVDTGKANVSHLVELF